MPIESNEKKEQSNLLDELKKLWKDILSGLGLSELLDKIGENSESATNISQKDNVENTQDKAEQQSSESKENTCEPAVEDAINNAINVANDDKNGYIKGGKGEYNKAKGFDCCGLVCYAFRKAGFDVPYTSCKGMKDEFQKAGFKRIPYDRNNLKKGDILLDEDKHTELYIGNGKTVGAHGNKDRKYGDSSGEEISITNGKYFLGEYHKKYHRDGVLRYEG